jgi:hypothetical protein
MEPCNFNTIGVEPVPCFVCGAEPRTLFDCLIATADNPEIVKMLFGIAGSRCYLDLRHRVKVGACRHHRPNIELLAKLIAPGYICVEAIESAMYPGQLQVHLDLMRAVKKYSQTTNEASRQYDDDAITASEFADKVEAAADLFAQEFKGGPRNHTLIEDAELTFAAALLAIE